uniref:Uncharacterized protein n=1 Tax=Rhinopithecus roxellana TaxID=61622 RepID=A0A2K6P605_RHIRO
MEAWRQKVGGGFPSCVPELHRCSQWRVGSDNFCWGSLGRGGEQALGRGLSALCPCHQWREEGGPEHLYLSGTWPLGRREGGLVFAGGEFPGHSQSPQIIPGVGRGVLDTLMFSTLTPFVFKVGVGATVRSGCWVGPLLSALPLPHAGLQSPPPKG